MRFYDREEELRVLRETAELSKTTSQFTIVLGRRRIGKTTLMLKGAEGTKCVYLFISRLAEPLLCERLVSACREGGVDIVGRIDRFGDLLKALMLHSRHEPLTVIIDEFQNLRDVNGSVFGDIQRVWDLHRGESRINIVAAGSVHSMMTRIFEDEREPLFNRPTRKLSVGPFRISVLKRILEDHNLGHSKEDLLVLYMITGGVPSYVSLLMDADATTKDRMLGFALSPGSTFLAEGDDLMKEEFGRDSKVYLSILQLIAAGRNRRPEMEDVLGMSIGEYLSRLEREYGFVSRRLPVLTDNPRLGRWTVSDMYLRLFFRYIQPNRSFVEAGRTDLLRSAVEEDLESYEGRVLEDLLRQRIAEEGTYTEIGGYWNRTGSVEIDIAVLDSVRRTAELIEVKRNPEKLDMRALERKADSMKDLLKGYEVTLRGMSMDDI